MERVLHEGVKNEDLVVLVETCIESRYAIGDIVRAVRIETTTGIADGLRLTALILLMIYNKKDYPNNHFHHSAEQLLWNHEDMFSRFIINEKDEFKDVYERKQAYNKQHKEFIGTLEEILHNPPRMRTPYEQAMHDAGKDAAPAPSKPTFGNSAVDNFFRFRGTDPKSGG
jgi:hypothetical protein